MELSATELRIGNLVTFNHKWDILCTVKQIQQYDIRVSFETQPNLMNALSTHPENFIPIELTEEWLLKFGFEKDNELNFVKFSFKVHFWSNYNSYMYGWVGGNIELKYVHQLQNLYFALTGEELTI